MTGAWYGKSMVDARPRHENLSVKKISTTRTPHALSRAQPNDMDVTEMTDAQVAIAKKQAVIDNALECLNDHGVMTFSDDACCTSCGLSQALAAAHEDNATSRAEGGDNKDEVWGVAYYHMQDLMDLIATGSMHIKFAAVDGVGVGDADDAKDDEAKDAADAAVGREVFGHVSSRRGVTCTWDGSARRAIEVTVIE